jgi:phage baseplate assembly protein gpV
VGGVQLADDRIYLNHFPRYDYSNAFENGHWAPKLVEQGGLSAIGGIRDGRLVLASSMIGDVQWPLAARGTKVALYTQGGMAIYDTIARHSSLLAEVQLRGYGYSTHVIMRERSAIASLGEWGMQTITY